MLQFRLVLSNFSIFLVKFLQFSSFHPFFISCFPFIQLAFLSLMLPTFLLLFSCSVMSDSLQPHGRQQGIVLSFTVSRSLLKLMSIELVMPYNHLILCRPLFLLPSIVPSIRVFSNESALHIRWPKYWSYSISPSNEYSGLISFRMD